MSTLSVRNVLELDLVSYSEVAHTLEQHLDAHAVKALEAQIQSFVDCALAEVGLPRATVVSATAGDSAILVFDTAAEMQRFADAFSALTDSHNRSKASPEAERWFRMGAATGPLSFERSPIDAIGLARIRAVRLESAAQPGTILIDLATFESLPPEQRARYGPELIVAGKRGERFRVRCCPLVERAHADDLAVLKKPSLLEGVWDQLDAELQDAFALAYNEKRRQRSDRPVRISTRDLFRALGRINDQALLSLFATLSPSALPEPADTPVTTDRRLFTEGHELSSCIAESLEAFAHSTMASQTIAPTDVFVDIAAHGHGPSVAQLREHGIGPNEIDERLALVGVTVFRPARLRGATAD